MDTAAHFGKPAAPYARHVVTSAQHSFVMLPRKRMTYLAGFLAISPVIIPLALSIRTDMWYAPNGSDVFIRLTQLVYVGALCPLLALLFGSSLIGEDIESQTYPYILTRPVPRSAWVLGKFLGYLAGTWTLLAASMFCTFLACTRLTDFDLKADDVTLFGHFALVLLASLGAYGAFGMLTGALVKHYIIIGLVFIFFWQRVALMLAGYIEFLTIEKYVAALSPDIEGMPNALEMAIQALGVQRLIIEITPWQAAIGLVAITGSFIAMTTSVTLCREYTGARASDS